MLTEFTVGTLMWAAVCGHLIGDFIFQEDLQAKHKTSNTLWCLVHVGIYTCCVVGLLGLFDPHWFNWKWVLIIAVPHFFIDRFRLSRQWMRLAQEQFATGPMSPWSIIVVDQVFHFVSLFITVTLFTSIRL